VATILIVDDRPSNRQFLTTLLGYGGHQLLEASDGAEALESVRSRHPDLVITDILMPTMDGYEFVRQVRADPALAPTPVIFYTATYSTPQAEALAKSCGVATVLPKPCEPQMILAAVNKMLGIRDPGAGEPPALAGGRAVPRAPSADDTLALYLRDLDEVQHNFEDLAKKSTGQHAERDSVKALSKKFAENVTAMQRITSRLSALLEVGMEMMRERDPGRLVELFFAAICDIVDSKLAAIGMLDEKERHVRHVFARGLDAGLFRGESGTTGLLATVLSGQRVLRARSPGGERSAEGLPKGHPPVRDLLAIPVASADRTHGWMYFADKHGAEGFSEEDTRLATAMTGRLALLYENAMLYDQIQRHAAELQIEVGERRRTETALAASEERFRSLSMLSSDWFWEQDEEHRFVKFSGGEGVKGWGPDQSKAVGLHRWDLGGVIPISCSWEEHKGMLDAHKPFRDFEYQRILGDGRLQYVAASGEPIFDAAGRFTGYRGVATEITRRKEAEARIKRLNRVYAVLSSINALILRVRGRDELFRESCRMAVDAGGFRMAWIGIVDPVAMAVKPVAWQGADLEYIQRMPVGLLDAGPQGRGLAGRAVREKAAISIDDMTQDPRVLLRDDARERGFRSLVMLPLIVRDEAVGVLALYAGEIGFFDHEEMKLLHELAGDIAFALDHIEKAEKLEYLAYYDPLTGLANRSLFLQRLGQKVLDAAAVQRKVAVWILDIERFRTINDAFGRQAGDKLLQDITTRMKALARDDTRMARIGGDQIAIMRDDMQSEEDLARFSERRIQDIFGEPYRVGDQDLRVSGRYGIALFPSDGGNAEALLQSAEAALKKAKVTGERYVFFAQEMTERIHEKLALESRLRQALEKEEFVLHYQPKVDAETRKVLGTEALIRWQSTEGLVPPGKFIPLMEQTGMIREAGAWALRRAVLDHRHWLRMGIAAPRVAVNVSAIQLRQQDFVDTVKEAIAHGANPTGLDLEITESLVMEDVQGNIRKLKAVRDLGVNIAIDDFGTGYSSLAYLAKLPVQTLKIDRSFIVGMGSDPTTMMLIQTMITLAHSLRLKVVAEGVETEEQANMLRLLRCDELQGFLFSKPVPIEELTPLLLERK
jgi:diguanylate cyclase